MTGKSKLGHEKRWPKKRAPKCGVKTNYECIGIQRKNGSYSVAPTINNNNNYRELILLK